MFGRKKKAKKDHVKPLETSVLIANTGSAEIVQAEAIDQETLKVDENENYSGVKPFVLSCDPRVLTTRWLNKLLLVLLIGRRIQIRCHYMLFGETFTRDIRTGEYVDQEKKQRVCDEYGRNPEDVSNIQFIYEESKQFIKSRIMAEYWRSARGHGVTYWLPWVICCIIAVAAIVVIAAIQILPQIM